MQISETELQMVTRHVLQGEVILRRQSVLIAKMKELDQRTVLAEILLDSFEIGQALHRDHLKRLQTSKMTHSLSRG